MNWKITNEFDYTKAPICWVRVLGEIKQVIEFCNMRGDNIDDVRNHVERLCERSKSDDKRQWFSYWVILSDDSTEVLAINNIGREDIVMFKIVRDE
jgi:hypothetical protein